MIRVDHVGMPARDREAAASLLADLFASQVAPTGGPFVAVRITNGFSLELFNADRPGPMHLALVADPEDFEAVVHRPQAVRIAYGSQPGEATNGRLDHPLTGRGLHFRTPGGHLLEVMAAPTLTGSS